MNTIKFKSGLFVNKKGTLYIYFLLGCSKTCFFFFAPKNAVLKYCGQSRSTSDALTFFILYTFFISEFIIFRMLNLEANAKPIYSLMTLFPLWRFRLENSFCTQHIIIIISTISVRIYYIWGQNGSRAYVDLGRNCKRVGVGVILLGSVAQFFSLPV